MKHLTLIRHAKSSWSNPSQRDFDRPLNQRGLRDAPMMGKRLAKAGTRFDLMLSSPAQRALTTCQLLAKEIEYPLKKISQDVAIYDASASTLLALINELDNSHGHVALVGHNPGISVLGHQFSESVDSDLSTCSVVQLAFATDSWNQLDPSSAQLLLLDFPKNSDTG